MTRPLPLLVLAVAVLAIALSCDMTSSQAQESTSQTDEIREQLGAPPESADSSIAADLSAAFRAAARRALPAVVFIQIEREAGAGAGPQPDIPEPFRFFFGPPDRGGEMPPQIGAGSGVIMDTEGRIITNSHVVADATRVLVRLVDGREFEAEIIGDDPSSDIAVIKIDPGDDRPLPVATMGSSDDVRVGDWVLALGSPLGLDFSVTAGIVSARGRQLSGRRLALESFIQTDAAINPGNSGGPLVGLNGEVIGINTAIFGAQRFVGYGFAVPISLAERVIDDLLEFGEVRRPRLGVQISDVTAVDADVYGLDEIRGADINVIEAGSPAESAGLELGDVIVAVDGDPVDDATDLTTTLARRRPGDTVELTVVRDGDRRQVEVELGRFEGDAAPGGQPREEVRRQTERLLGFRVEALTPAIAERLGIDRTSGVVIADVAPFSAAANAGVRPGAVVLAINGDEVASVGDVDAIADNLTPGSVLSLRLLVPEIGETIVNFRTRR